MTQHPSRPYRSRRQGTGFAFFAALALAASAFTGSALAAPGSGKVVLSLTAKGAESSLLSQGVKLSYTAKAGKTGATKRAVASHGGHRHGKGKSRPQAASLPVTDLDLSGTATIHTAGALKLSNGKRRAVLRDVVLESAGERVAISARLGKRRLVVFRASGSAEIGRTSVSLHKAPLSLTGNGADAIAQRLALGSLSAGRLGALSFDARLLVAEAPKKAEPEAKQPDPDPKGPIDPYFQQCGVDVTSDALNSLPEATPPPTLSDAKSTVAPAEATWGFKLGFRGYIVGGAGGSLHALDGASTNGSAPLFSSFDFPVTTGEYTDNDPVDTSDDQAVVESGGTALFCGTGHGFRVAISNPTVVIDGDGSRIVADVDTNLSGVWTPAQTIDLADLDLDGIAPFYNHSGSEVNWGAIPASLTEAGAEAICGGEPACVYEEGTELDSIDVAVKAPYDTGAGDAAAWNALASYVSTELPFPLPDATQGGCTLPATTGGSSVQARTIDEHLALGGTSAVWNPDGAGPTWQPDLSGDTAITAGNFDWGFRRALRGSVNATGDFNLFGGVTASDPYFGNGGSLGARPGQMSNTTAQPSKYFRWAAANGFYEANGAGNADDRLVLQTNGRVAFCQVGAGQGYGIVLSNPTIVIDGANSRITVDVTTRYRLSWVRGRVDLARFDLTDPGATVSESSDAGTTTVEWKFTAANETVVPNAGPVELTEAGEAVVSMIGPTLYLEGLGLDAAAIKVSFPTPGP